MFTTAGAANAEFELAFRGTDQEATKFTQILQADLASVLYCSLNGACMARSAVASMLESSHNVSSGRR